MALQLVDVYTSALLEDLDLPKDEFVVLDRWNVALTEDRTLVRFLLNSDQTEALLDAVQDASSGSADYRIIVSNVEATLPRPEEKVSAKEDHNNQNKTPRISREELYQDIDEALRVNRIHYTLVVLSTVVAAVGMLRNNVAVVIGAMVIAPLIGPNMAFALGTTLGDTDLLRRAAKTNLAGISLAFMLSVIAGLLISYDPTISEIASRSRVNLADIGLALAAGIAGALSMTRGVSSALIGVMVAVALLPPLVAVGLFVGAGHWGLAYRAALLLCSNVAAINFAGVVTFLLLGIRPNLWHEEKQAMKATRIAIFLWVIFIGLLVVAIVLANPVSQ